MKKDESLENVKAEINVLLDDNREIMDFKKTFAKFGIDIPVNVRKKLDAREKRNNNSLTELMKKQTRLLSAAIVKIEQK